MIGQVIGNYRIVSELGKGGMGMVYRAEHVQLGRPAALKMLQQQLSSDATIVQRFFNEARAASAIDHPGIVEIYDFGTHSDGRAYIVMALLKGESLEHRLRRGPMPPHEGATIVAQAVAALAAAHACGIVHRDLKPDNLFLVPNDLMPGGIQVKLLDFGIAKLADDQTAGFKTQTGALMGTPAYMSPEQCMGRADLDHRTDIYAVGCILFHVFCGRPPFTSDQGTGMMIAAHIRDAAPDPRSFEPRLPEALAAIVLRCLAKEPNARYQTATELRNALVAAGANAPLSRPPGAEQYAATLAAQPSSPGSGWPGSPGSPSSPDSPGSMPTGHAATAPGAYAATAHPSAPSGYPGAHVSGAATTRSGAAGQIVSAAPTTAGPRRPRAALVIGGVLVAAIGGAAVLITRINDDRSTVTTASTGATARDSTSPSATARDSTSASGTNGRDSTSPSTTARDSTSAGGVVARDSTSSGTTARDSTSAGGTNGRDSTSRGQTARDASGKRTGGSRVTAGSDTASRSSTAMIATSAPSFRLDAKVVAPGEEIEIRFAAPVSSKPQSRAWITVIAADQPPSAYGEWSYLDDGATSATLKAPSKPGAYEVRLHTDYPAKSFNVQHTVALTIGPEAEAPQVTPLSSQRFTVGAATVKPGAKVHVTFATALHAAPKEQFWVTIVEAGAADSSWGAYEYVQPGARRMQLAAPTKPGDYEVRLHANYPTKTTNLVHRVAIHVE
jgi:eukaryotic-like serine/threonine-protein kinase